MKYIDVYKRRVSHLGTNYQEHAYNSGILEFRRYLKYNSHTEHNLLIDGTKAPFSGVILTDKEDENRVSQILLTKVVEDGGPELKPGDLLWWGEDTQPWLLYRSTTSSYQPHQKFYMVRCNYKIKWVDQEGFLKESWTYLLGSKDSKIKDNFRTWHNAITPQPNKYINIMMPHQLMAINTEIMVLDEVWYLVDYDQASVPGVIYMSFTETNFNEQRDSIEEGIANIDKLANWKINMLESRIVEPGAEFNLDCTLFKNGVVQKIAPEILLEGNLTMTDDGKIKAGLSGSGIITARYKDIIKKQFVVVGGTPQAKMNVIGSNKIRVASKGNKFSIENVDSNFVEFELVDWKDKNGEIPMPVKELIILSSFKQEGNTCKFDVNTENKLGKFILNIKYKGNLVFSKDITVVSLWQVI